MPGPLTDIVVIDVSRALAGPHAAMMLGDLGARVIKVEAPGTGDDTRGWGPPFATPADAAAAPESTYFLSCNRNKESIVLDMKTPEGRHAIERLAARADVFIENFRAGTLDKLGLPFERLQALNPRLVLLSITGFGHDGPEGHRPGYDQILQGEAGLMTLTGPDSATPTRVGLPIGDVLAGIYGAFGVVSALHRRNRTGRGGVVRTSLLAALIGAHAYQGTRWTVAREVPRAEGNQHPSIAPYGAFRTRDGFVLLGVATETLWQRFASLTGLDTDDPRFVTNATRVAHREALIAEIERLFADRSTEYWFAKLDRCGIPVGRVRTLDELYNWDQTRSQGLLLDVDHPTLGPIQLPGPPLRYDDEEPIIHRPPPTLGQHQREVLEWLGFDEVDRP